VTKAEQTLFQASDRGFLSALKLPTGWRYSDMESADVLDTLVKELLASISGTADRITRWAKLSDTSEACILTRIVSKAACRKLQEW